LLRRLLPISEDTFFEPAGFQPLFLKEAEWPAPAARRQE
jgi:hypothetical protein